MTNDTATRGAYDYYRDEIQREDLITHQRISTSLAFQGILMAAMALVLTNGSFAVPAGMDAANADMLDKVRLFRLHIMVLIGVIGFVVATGSTIGIHAAQRSLRATRTKWKNIEPETGWANLPDMDAPQGSKRIGRTFPYFMSASFCLIWSIYLGLFCSSFWSDIF